MTPVIYKKKIRPIHPMKMSHFKFEGDFETLSDVQINLVENVLQKEGFKDGNVIVEPVGQKGDNCMANVKRFICEKSDGSHFKMIGKGAPTAEKLRKMMNTADLFLNEIVMYEEVIPKFNELQYLANIPENEKVRFPLYYGSISEAPNEFVLLEDLAESGLEMLDRFQPLNDDTVRTVLRDLAKFHSLSFALKQNNPETYDKVTNKLFNMWLSPPDDAEAKVFLEANENDMKLIVDTEEHRKVITDTLTQVSPLIAKLQSYEKGSKYSVIQHGDCWSNNILVRLQDGKAVEDVMIDYQLSTESNPAGDLLFFILNCTDYESRSKYYHDWIDYYHKMLDHALSHHDLKSNHVFPRDQLDTHLRRYGKIMVGIALMRSSMLVRESKDFIDLKDLPGEDILDNAMSSMRPSTLDEVTTIKLKLRIEGIIDSALDFGII